MKYTQEIEIALPLARTIELFEDQDNLHRWQQGFVSKKTTQGDPGKEGAKADLVYQMGKRKVEMIETIVKRDLPENLDGLYETKGVTNWQYNSFEPLGEERCKWISTSEFKFQGFMRAIGFLMPGAFKKQSYKYMTDFKAFAEGA